MEGASSGGTTAGAVQAAEGQSVAQNLPDASSQAQETKPTGRERILERFRKSHPDRSFDGENGENDLFGLIADEFDRSDSEAKKRNERDEQMNKLFHDQPESADLFRRWAKGEGNPFDDIVDNYPDLIEEGLQSEEGRQKLKDARAARLKKQADDKEADEAYEKNIGETFSKALREFADENGLSDEQAAEVFLEARERVNSALDGIYGKDFFQMIHDGKRYRNDVALAREEGEINGRNAKIKAELRKSAPRKGAPALGGEGGAEKEDEGGKPAVMSMFGVPIKKKK